MLCLVAYQLHQYAWVSACACMHVYALVQHFSEKRHNVLLSDAFNLSFDFFFYFQVRDRATLFLSILGNDGLVDTDKDSKDFLFGSLEAPLVNLETSLKNYVSFHFFVFFPSSLWDVSYLISLNSAGAL